MLKGDDGKVKLKLDAMPVSDFDGWVNVFDLDDENRPAASAPPPAPSGFKQDEDLPF
jgi:hypothetical protein